MAETFDLAIVGGGPAGVACALAASRAGLSVALFEARRTLCDKPCGEGVMPSGVAALRELGLDDVVSRGRPFARLRYVVSDAAPLEIAMAAPGWAIERQSLMRGLEDALCDARGVTRFFGRTTADRPQPGDTAAGFRIASPTGAVRSRLLAVADGLSGKTAAWMRGGPAVRLAARFGIRARYRARRPLDGVEIHFRGGTEVYVTPLTGERVNVAILFGEAPPDAGGCRALLDRALGDHPRARDLLGEEVTAPEARNLAYGTPKRVAHAGVFLVGDAGGGVDPILGSGVALALESGILAAQSAREVVDGDGSGGPERRYAREYRRRTRTRRALAACLLGLSSRPWLARGAVELGRHASGIVGSLVGIAAGYGA